MRALTVEPGQSGPPQVTEVPEPHPGEGAVLAEGLALGVCGTGKEIVRGEYGTGRPWEARALFDRLLDLRNDLGLLSEEYDPVTGGQVGNTPQAFSMAGLINSTRQLTGALAYLASPARSRSCSYQSRCTTLHFGQMHR